MTYHLSIDTSQTENIGVCFIRDDGTRYEKLVTSTVFRSQSVLPTIESILNEQKILITDITDVTIALGPGSFTGLRVGAAVGATISWYLSLPINGYPAGSIPPLAYGEDKWNL